MSTNGKQDPRHSISLKHNLPSEGGVELRYHPDASRSYRMSEVPYLGQTNKPDDILTSGFYRLSLNGYHTYMERFVISFNQYKNIFFGNHYKRFNILNFKRHLLLS